MIRINLVAPEKAAKAKAKAGPAMPPGALQSYLLLALLVGGACVLCAGAWWLQSNKLRDLETRIAADEKRQRDLQAIAAQVAHQHRAHQARRRAVAGQRPGSCGQNRDRGSRAQLRRTQ